MHMLRLSLELRDYSNSWKTKWTTTTATLTISRASDDKLHIHATKANRSPQSNNVDFNNNKHSAYERHKYLRNSNELDESNSSRNTFTNRGGMVDYYAAFIELGEHPPSFVISDRTITKNAIQIRVYLWPKMNDNVAVHSWVTPFASPKPTISLTIGHNSSRKAIKASHDKSKCRDCVFQFHPFVFSTCPGTRNDHRNDIIYCRNVDAMHTLNAAKFDCTLAHFYHGSSSI